MAHYHPPSKSIITFYTADWQRFKKKIEEE